MHIQNLYRLSLDYKILSLPSLNNRAKMKIQPKKAALILVYLFGLKPAIKEKTVVIWAPDLKW